MGQVVAWVSVLLAFGSIQGVIYLKAYWGRFGLDPFQFSDAHSLGLVGLTGVGVTVALMGVAALVGSWVGEKLDDFRHKRRWLAIGVVVSLLGGLVALAFLVDWGVYLAAGVVLTWFLIVLAHHSPVIPAALAQSSWLPYLALALAYVPLASHHYGHRQADKVMTSAIRAVMEGPALRGGDRGQLRLAGRLGDAYVMFRPDDRSVLIVPVASVDSLLLSPPGRPTEARPVEGEEDERVASPPR